MSRLFHVSDRAGIARFEPRPATDNPAATGEVVWAVDEEHLPNYLLPRDCPRVCFAANALSSPHDRDTFLNGSKVARVIVADWEWLERIRTATLYLYELPQAMFELNDGNAGYYISREPVVPQSMAAIADLLQESKNREVELRFVPELWTLHDAVANSTLEFSMIRMRNARKRLLPSASSGAE